MVAGVVTVGVTDVAGFAASNVAAAAGFAEAVVSGVDAALVSLKYRL